MKKLFFLFVCLVLVCPSVSLAKKPTNNGIGSYEVAPQVVDANGKTVGYFVGSSFLMNYNGQEFFAPNTSQGGFTSIQQRFYFEESDCYGQAYAFNVEMNGWGLPSGFVYGGKMYLVSEDQAGIAPDLTLYHSLLRPDGTCFNNPDGRWPTSQGSPGCCTRYAVNPNDFFFDISTEFQLPYKLLFGRQEGTGGGSTSVPSTSVTD